MQPLLEYANPRDEPLTGAIAILGVGGAGCNEIVRLSSRDNVPVRLIAANTKAETINSLPLKNKVLLGQSITRGASAGGIIKVGEAAMQESLPDVLAAIGKSESVIIIAGLGGGTGSGGINALIPALAGKRVVLTAIMPFDFEDSHRRLAADETLAWHVRGGMETIILRNQRLKEQFAPRGATFADAFNAASAALYEAICNKMMVVVG